jgi:Family of unknown function (DUF6194)
MAAGNLDESRRSALSTLCLWAALDSLLPHPVYAPQSSVCVLNPGAETFKRTVKPLLAEAYETVAKRHATRPSK